MWTEYLQNLHSARSLDAVLDLAGSTYTLSKDVSRQTQHWTREQRLWSALCSFSAS